MACGISNSTDGSEDGSIHCMKLGQIAHSASNAIATETACLNSSQPSSSNALDDSFTDLDPEPEEDECVIDDE